MRGQPCRQVRGLVLLIVCLIAVIPLGSQTDELLAPRGAIGPLEPPLEVTEHASIQALDDEADAPLRVALRTERLAIPALDRFLCYSVRTTPRTPPFEPVSGLKLTDEFEEKAFDVKRPIHLCNPANKNDEGITDAITHIEAYRIEEVGRSCIAESPVNPLGACTREEECGGFTRVTNLCRRTPKHAKQIRIEVHNQFGTLFVDTIEPAHLLVPTAKSLDHPVEPPDHASHHVDHYKCYDAKVTPGTPAFPGGLRVTIDDQLADEPRAFDVTKPSRLCPPVDKDNEGIKDAATFLMCYQVKLAKGEPRQPRITGIHVHNQLGPEQLDAIRPEELCVPSTRTVTPPNQPPIARAGPDQQVMVGDTVQLDGGASSDPDGDPLRFRWAIHRQTSGEHGNPLGPHGSQPDVCGRSPRTVWARAHRQRRPARQSAGYRHHSGDPACTGHRRLHAQGRPHRDIGDHHRQQLHPSVRHRQPPGDHQQAGRRHDAGADRQC